MFISFFLEVQVDYNVVYLRTSLVQLFVLLLQNFEKVVQMIELNKFGGAPNGYPFRACLGELQLRKNSSRAADPRSSTVEQLYRGSEI
jgi:hypothetical protein